MPVGLVNKHGTEVTHDVDDAEDDAPLGDHGEVRTTAVVHNGAAGLSIVRMHTVGAVAGRRGDGLELVIHGAGRAEGRVAGGVHEHDEGEQDDEDDRGVDVGGHEGGLETTRHGVRDNTDGDQETRHHGVHAGQRVDGGGATEDQHRRDDDVREEAEVDEHLVRGGPPARVDDLAHSVRGGREALDLDREDAEKKHLDGGAGGVPERAGDAVLERDV